MKTLKSYKNKIPSDINIACITAKEIIDFFQNSISSLSECNIFELKVILNELIINAVKHGNKCDPFKFVNINAGICPRNYVYMIVEDQGDGYDYETLMSCSNEGLNHEECLFDLKESGRGILIVRSLSDNIRFNKKGNKIIVLKKIHKC